MPVQAIWAWTEVVSGNVTGSLEVNLGTQSFVYVATAIQRLQSVELPRKGTGGLDLFPGISIDAKPLIDSYMTADGVTHQVGSPLFFDSNVDSVNFAWTFGLSTIDGGSIVGSSQYLFQILSFG